MCSGFDSMFLPSLYRYWLGFLGVAISCYIIAYECDSTDVSFISHGATRV